MGKNMGLTFNGTEIGSDIKINGNTVQNLKMGSSDVWSGRVKLPSLPCNYVKKIIYSYHQSPGGVYIIGGSSSSDCKNVYEVLTVDQKVTGYRLCYTASYNILDGCEDINYSTSGGYLILTYDSTQHNSSNNNDYTRSARVKVKNGSDSSKDDGFSRNLIIEGPRTFNQKGFTVGGTFGQILFYFGTPLLSPSYVKSSYYSYYCAVIDVKMNCTFYGKNNSSDKKFVYCLDNSRAPSSVKYGMGLNLLGEYKNRLSDIISLPHNNFNSYSDAMSMANQLVNKITIEIEDVSFGNSSSNSYYTYFFIKYKLTNTETGSYKNIFSPVYRIVIDYDYYTESDPYVCIHYDKSSSYTSSDAAIVSRIFVDHSNYENYIRKTSNLYTNNFSDNSYHRGITWFKGYGLYENGFIEMPDNLNKNLDFIPNTPIRTGDELCYITTSGQIVQYNPVLNKFWIR